NDRASSHSNLSEQKSHVEIGLKLNDYDYSFLELIKKVGIINGTEFLIISIGIISSIIHGCLYPVFAIILANIFQAFSQTGDTLRHEATFWALMLLVFSVTIFLVTFIQDVTLGISSEILTERIRSMSFASILRQDISFFDDENHSVGALTSRLSLDATYIN
ncbi:12544_t:CDS:2, partial [Gigaspora margarita]